MTSATGDFSAKTKFCNEVSNAFDPLSNKLPDRSPESSSRLDHISNLKSMIDQVENLKILPSIHVYSLMSDNKGLSATDVSPDLSHLAFSFPDSREINLISRKSLSDAIARNDVTTAWLNYLSAKNRLAEVGKSEAGCLSSPQASIFKHDNVSGLCFSSNNNVLLSCSLNGSIKVISTKTYCVLEHYDGVGSSTDIDVNSITTQFVTVNDLSESPFHAAYLYNFERTDYLQYFSGHKNSLKCVRFHPNGLYIATASSDKTIKLWSVHQSKEVRSFREEGMHPEKITFSPDGKYIASTHGGCVNVWDISSGKKLKCLKTSNLQSVTLNICYSADGSFLAAGGSDEKIHIWKIRTDRCSKVIPNYEHLKSENLGKPIFSLKCASNFFSCVTG